MRDVTLTWRGRRNGERNDVCQKVVSLVDSNLFPSSGARHSSSSHYLPSHPQQPTVKQFRLVARGKSLSVKSHCFVAGFLVRCPHIHQQKLPTDCDCPWFPTFFVLQIWQPKFRLCFAWFRPERERHRKKSLQQFWKSIQFQEESSPDYSHSDSLGVHSVLLKNSIPVLQVVSVYFQLLCYW